MDLVKCIYGFLNLRYGSTVYYRQKKAILANQIFCPFPPHVLPELRHSDILMGFS